MSTKTTVSTILMGAESLLIQCGEILLEGGHQIGAVITKDGEIRQWATEVGVPIFAPGPDLPGQLPEVDYFFSIANLSVIDDAVLAKAKHGGVNFHDGPLPRYAGLYCTSWALAAGESSHGVTWHKIEGGIDEGDILVQKRFDLEPNETALTLNTQCYAAGMESFRELIGLIETDKLKGQKQDLSKRTYFGRFDRPEAQGLIDWTQPADKIVALVRALDFGAYANPLSLAKTRLGEQLCVVREAEIAAAESAAVPGTVLAVSSASITISCADSAIKITTLTCLASGPLDIEKLAEAGQVLPALSADERVRLTELNETAAKSESYWTGRLKAADLDLSGLHTADPTALQTTALKTPEGLEGQALCAALLVALGRVGDVEAFRVGYRNESILGKLDGLEDHFSAVVPLSLTFKEGINGQQAGEYIGKRISKANDKGFYSSDLFGREPGLQKSTPRVVLAQVSDAGTQTLALGSKFTLYVDQSGAAVAVHSAQGDAGTQLCHRLEGLCAAFADKPDAPILELPLITEAEREKLLLEWNNTVVEFDRTLPVHRLFEQQVDRTPDATALVFESDSLTYRELDERANKLAHRLRELGVVPDQIVGLLTERCADMLVGMLGIQKAGGAYLPLDPAFPKERLEWMLQNSATKTIVSQTHLRGVLDLEGMNTVMLDEDSSIEDKPQTRLEGGAGPEHLSYVIYTSGSTGRPKGVMVEHRNVANFFTGMDACIAHEPPGVWLAVTSLSFDISVLELAWTLARGFEVVIYRDRRAETGQVSAKVSGRPMDFGLCYWGNDDQPGRGKYKLLLEGAKFADTHGFHSIWTPERHFHAFGGPYANPSVSGAAAAALTRNLHIRSASVVLPLHHPIRVAEEWAMLDNLSDGRVGIGIAAGWQPDDFVLRPENRPPNHKTSMFRDIEVLRSLWRGEEVQFPKGDGTMHGIISQPRPVQKELPIWMTIAGNPDSYVQAADIGANVLTHLLGQSVAELTEKIKLYRDRWLELGRDPAEGKVTLMLHTFVSKDRETARNAARQPMKTYLASAASLIKKYVWMFPAIKKPKGTDRPENIDLASLTAEETDAVLEFAFERYFEDSGLFGTVDDAVVRVNELKAIGVDEIGCLVDYGIKADVVLESFEYLAEVVKRTSRPKIEADYSFAAQVESRKVTHLQCTPSMGRMLMLEEDSKQALSKIDHVMMGGEALPLSLAQGVHGATEASLRNMYGPTETTIWSSTDPIDKGVSEITIGRAVANTTLYVLDKHRQLVPPKTMGELYIGGEGVTRGYLGRDDLTAERFFADPFSKVEGARMYRTGDLVRSRDDGRFDFHGRVDHQVKIRGYRIELPEIESLLEEYGDVREAVVVARTAPDGDQQLVAYLTSTGSPLDPNRLRTHLRAKLPAYMVPAHFVPLDRFPLTPNKKVDRLSLPAPEDVAARKEEFIAPESDLQQQIAQVWSQVLGLEKVGLTDNFFDLGGHSLLAVKLHRELQPVTKGTLSMTDIFRFPTVQALANHVGDGGAEGAAELEKVANRAAARRSAARGGARRRVLKRGPK